MPIIVDFRQVKAHLPQILDPVRAGEEVLITRAGRACARLVRVEEGGVSRHPARIQGRVDPSFFDPLITAERIAWGWAR